MPKVETNSPTTRPPTTRPPTTIPPTTRPSTTRPPTRHNHVENFEKYFSVCINSGGEWVPRKDKNGVVILDEKNEPKGHQCECPAPKVLDPTDRTCK